MNVSHFQSQPKFKLKKPPSATSVKEATGFDSTCSLRKASDLDSDPHNSIKGSVDKVVDCLYKLGNVY